MKCIAWLWHGNLVRLTIAGSVRRQVSLSGWGALGMVGLLMSAWEAEVWLYRLWGLNYERLRDMGRAYVRWRTHKWWRMRAMTRLVIPSLYSCNWGRTRTPEWRFLKGGGQSLFCRIGHLFIRATSTAMLSASCCRLMAQTNLVSPLLAKFPTLRRNLSLPWATWIVPLRCILLLPHPYVILLMFFLPLLYWFVSFVLIVLYNLLVK